MSSSGTVREEPSPQDDTQAPKRRRIAFSCLDCRRRKLRCDRVFPSCSRCQKSGKPGSCTYDSGAIESAPTHFSEERNRPRDFSTANSYAASRTVPRLPSVAPSFVADDGVERRPRTPSADTTARLYAQDERIRQLEYRIIGLEKAAHAIRSLERTQAEVELYSDSRTVVDKEAMIYRGKSFKTQFYGATHHMSYLSHVRRDYFSTLICHD